MICVSLPGPSLQEIKKQIDESKEFADLFELRCDLYPNLQTIKEAFDYCPLPVIMTCRRLCWIKQLAALKPAYIDLDHTVSDSFQAGSKVIRSYHNFDETPKDLKQIFERLTKFPADLYKIATNVLSILDCFRLLEMAQKSSVPLIVVGMGELGECTRILAPVFKCPLVYASPNESETTAPGQLSAETLVNTYHHRHIGPDTKLYGLIGDPVSQSIGHLYHNAYMNRYKALYVRLRVKKEELSEFLPQAIRLGFQGFSVTIPHKEEILQYIENSHPIGAVNTLIVKENKLWGDNTDAEGALDALESVIQVADKRVVILGAGGSSRAIAYEAIRRGAQVTLLNRTEEKAQKLAFELGCRGGGLDELGSITYDALINTTPHSCPINQDLIQPQSVAMDLSITPCETEFLLAAKRKKGTLVDGRAMFKRQAEGQKKIWFN